MLVASSSAWGQEDFSFQLLISKNRIPDVNPTWSNDINLHPMQVRRKHTAARAHDQDEKAAQKRFNMLVRQEIL